LSTNSWARNSASSITKLQPTDIHAIECGDPNLRHVPALAKADDLSSHVEVQLVDDILHSFEIETPAIIKVSWACWSEDDPCCPYAERLLVNYFVRSKASAFIARSRRLIFGKGIDSYACDAQASKMSLDFVEESRSNPATAKAPHNTNIRNVSHTIGIRRFADVLPLLDPAGDEACENRIAMRHEYSPAAFGTAKHPIKVGIRDLVARQARHQLCRIAPVFPLCP
jgi:hypothetical protein